MDLREFAVARVQSVQSWRFITDVIANVPVRLNRLLRMKILCGDIGYRDRVYLASFCYLNGIPFDALTEALILNRNVTYVKLRKIRELYSYWGEGAAFIYVDRRRRYRSWNILFRHMTDLNGAFVRVERPVVGVDDNGDVIRAPRVRRDAVPLVDLDNYREIC